VLQRIEDVMDGVIYEDLCSTQDDYLDKNRNDYSKGWSRKSYQKSID